MKLISKVIISAAAYCMGICGGIGLGIILWIGILGHYQLVFNYSVGNSTVHSLIVSKTNGDFLLFFGIVSLILFIVSFAIQTFQTIKKWLSKSLVPVGESDK